MRSKRLNSLCNSIFWMLGATVFFVVLVNAVFYPHCNRKNRECFLIQHAWHDESKDLMQLADKRGW